MVGQKFFVYGGGRWREINLSTGRVAGWGVVEYMSARRGRLELTQKNAVLRGLKALAAGKPTSVHDGPQLSQIRHIKTKSVEEPKSINNSCQHHQHCCQHIIHSNTDANFNNLFKPITSTVAVQCTISNRNTSHRPKETTVPDKPSQLVIKKLNTLNNKKKSDQKNESAKRNRQTSESSDVFNTTDSQKTNSDGRLGTSLAERVNTSEQIQEPCKELLISEEDVLLIRTFVEHDDQNVFGVDLERFDSDDLYKSLVFYQLNPLVNVEKSEEVDELVKKKSVLTESFKDFIKNLGLQSVEEASQVSSSKYKMRARRKRVRNAVDETEYRKMINSKKTGSNEVSGQRTKQVVLRDEKTGRFLSTTGLVKGSKARPASKKRRETIQNDLGKDKDGAVKNNDDKTNEAQRKIKAVKENYLKNNHEFSEKNESFKLNDLSKTHKQRNVNESTKQKETEKLNKTTEKKDKVKENKSDKQKVSDKVISNELNTKETQNDSDSVLVSSDSDDKRSDKREKARMPRLAVVPAKRNESRRQPYTTAEDTILVQWVRGPGRARQVNGNNLWRELQPIFQKKTGSFRSWHSLRNRYLRSLLPTLGSMSIPADEAARLRAAAAAGELKSKKMLNNSIYKEKRVESAWSRRPRSPLRKSPSPVRTVGSPNSSNDSSSRKNDSDYTAESSASEESRAYKKIDHKDDKNKRTLRSSAVGTSPSRKQRKINAQTPTYSELTKRFALKHSTPDSDTSGHNNTDKSVRPTRLLRKNATDRQNDGSGDDQRTEKGKNSKSNENNTLNNSKKRARQMSSDREDDSDRNDRKKAKQLRSAQQNSKNNSKLNNGMKRIRQISTDRQEADTNDDQNKTERPNSKHVKSNNLSINRRNTRRSLIDRQGADSGNDQRNGKRLRNGEANSNNMKNNHSNNEQSIIISSDEEDTDTSDDQTKTKQLTSKHNNINNSRRRTRNISSDRQETDTESESSTKSLRSSDRQNSKNSKSNLNNTRKRARKSSTDEDTDTSDGDEQFTLENKNKTINLNKSSNNRQNTSDKINHKSNSLRKSDRHTDKNNSIHKNKRNDSNKIPNDRHDSSDSSDFEEDVRIVKKLRSSNTKADTDRPKTRRLFNPKAF